MKLFISLTLLFIVKQTVSIYYEMRDEWEAYKTKYNKVYETEIEEEFRMKIFVENALSIARHNKRYAQGLVGYEQGINQFSDMLPHEFSETMLTLIPDDNETLSKIPTFRPFRNVKLPDEVDWRKEGAVTPVKDQTTMCGSCYAFAATGVVESHNFIVNKKLVSLSEQNIVDCTHNEIYRNKGCNGGSPGRSLIYIKDNEGIDTEESYPYLARDNETCHYNASNKGATIEGIRVVRSGDEDNMKMAVALLGPVAAGMDASHDSFNYFKGKGVYYEPECSSTELCHAVLVVGYGTTEDGEDYWLIKNSWGTDWGDKGYFKLARNRNNHCGIAQLAVFPDM